MNPDQPFRYFQGMIKIKSEGNCSKINKCFTEWTIGDKLTKNRKGTSVKIF